MCHVELKWLAVAELAVLASASAFQKAKTAMPRIRLAKLQGNVFVKKIGSQLTQVAGMEKVEGDLITLPLTQPPAKKPSPKALWEATEKANHVPTRKGQLVSSRPSMEREPQGGLGRRQQGHGPRSMMQLGEGRPLPCWQSPGGHNVRKGRRGCLHRDPEWEVQGAEKR